MPLDLVRLNASGIVGAFTMQISVKLFAAGTLILGLSFFVPQPALATTVSCSVKDKKFVCAENSKDNAAVFAALAAPLTADNIKAVSKKGKIFADNKERELYRLSLERARKAAMNHADRAFHQMKRRKLSTKDYEIVRGKFNMAVEHYRAALELYHAQAWYSASRDKNAEGSD